MIRRTRQPAHWHCIFRKAWLTLTLLLAVSGPASTRAQPAETPGDYAGFERFPGSEISDYRYQEDTTYQLPLDRMQRVGGQVAPGRSERLRGELRRITYAIPEGYSAREAYEHFSDQLLTTGQSELFECQGRGCGSSSYWANDVFNNRVLYGPVGNQYYMATTYRSVHEGETVRGYAALYTITRGNRRVYAHLDFLELPAEEVGGMSVTPAAIQLRLDQEGAVVLQNISFDENDELVNDAGVAPVVETLRNDTLLQVFLVGHLRESGAQVDTLIERSRQRADRLRERLIGAGIAAERIAAHGVGPLAPYCRPRPCSERIELVLQP